MKKLLLISPLASKSLLGGDFYFRLPYLGLLKVAALTPPDWDVSIIDDKVEKLDLNQEADLVGITSMTPAVSRGYEIADHFRQRGIKVVMGGMHISNMPDEARQHCDSVVIGEAEGLWPQVLEDFKNNSMKPVYSHNGAYPSLANLPVPNWNLYSSKNYLPVHFLETTRGCPNNCEFCSVTSAFGGKYRSRPIDEVEHEIKNFKRFEGLLTLKNVVFFVDDNIISNKSYAKDFLKRIIPYNLKWFGQASVNIAKEDELLDLFRKSGCTGIVVGLETLSSENLSKMGKAFNKPQQYMDVINKIHDHGIGIDAGFVFGFDHDDEGVFDRTLEFVIKAKLEVAFFSILTPYPGTRIYKQMLEENRLLTRNWSYYNTNNVVFRPKLMSPEKLLEGYYHALKEFHSYSSILKRLWGTKAYKNFFYPMNFGFRQTIKKTTRHRPDFSYE